MRTLPTGSFAKCCAVESWFPVGGCRRAAWIDNGVHSMPVVEAMLRLESEGLLLKQAREQATIDHDADSAEYLMKRHFQSGYAEVQRITLLRHPSLARCGEKGGWGMRHDAIEEQEGL